MIGSAGGLTNDSTPTVTGTAEDGSTVTLFEGSAVLGTATADASTGAWSIDSSTLLDGSHTLSASATDAAGNTGSAATVAFSIDTQAPDAPVIGSAGGPSNDSTPAVSGTAEPGSTVTLYEGATTLGTATADASTGAWSIDSSTLLDGSHTLSASATDAAGNTGSASTVSFTIDTQAPDVPVIASVGPDNGASSTDHITSATTLTISGTAEAGSTVTLFEGGTFRLGTVAADSGGSWSFVDPFPVFFGGSLSFTASATDAAGNASSKSAAFTITVDTSAPFAPTISEFFTPDTGVLGDGITKATSITLSGFAEPGSTVTVSEGASALGTTSVDGSGHWAFTTSGTLSEGLHFFGATATDAAGNTGAPSSAFIVKVDTAAPVATVTAVTPDNGTSSSDHLTSATSLTISGSAEAGSTVTVFDNGSPITTVKDIGGSSWSFIDNFVGDGLHSFTASATDAAGNSGAPSSAFTMSVDTIAPDAPVFGAFGPDSGVTGDGLTNATSLTLSGTAEAGSTVEVFQDGVSIGTTTANAGGSWTATTTGTLAGGTHTFTAKATDVAGNTSFVPSQFGVVIDTQAPNAPVIDSAGGLSNDNTPTVTGTAEDRSTVTLFEGNTVLGTATADSTGAWSIDSSTLLDGSHTLSASATDAAGNTGSASTLAFSIDTHAPDAPVIGSAGGPSNDSTPTVTGTAEDGSTVTLFEGGTVLGTTTADASTGAWSIDSSTLLDGSHTLSASATDAAGNTGSASTLAFSIDTHAPDAPSVLSLDASTDSGTIDDNVTTYTQVKVDGTAEPSSTVTIYDGITAVGTGTADGPGAFGITTSTLSTGTHSLTAKATDAAGNTGSASTALPLTIVSLGPTIAINTVAGDNTVNGSEATAGFAISGATAGVQNGQLVTVKLLNSSNVVVKSYTTTVSSNAWSVSVPSAQAKKLADGGYTVTADVSNAAGTTAPEAIQTLVVDRDVNEAPTIHLSGLTGGVAPEGSTITATVTVPDNDLTGSITYNWQTSLNNGKSWTTVQSTTSNSFTTSEANEGSLLRVSISTTDQAGNQVTGTSASALINDPAPTLTITGSTSLNVNAGGSIALPISVAGSDADDTVSVNISGLPKYEQITDTLDSKTFTGKSITLTAAEVNSGLTLTSTYKGTGQPVATLTVTALNTTAGETSKSAPQTITVTDPPLATSGTTATLDSITQRSNAGLVTLPAQAGYMSVDAFNNLPPGIDATSFLLLGKPDPHSGAGDQVNSPATAGLNPSLLLQSMASFGASGAPGGTFSSLADNVLNAAQNVVTVDPHNH